MGIIIIIYYYCNIQLTLYCVKSCLRIVSLKQRNQPDGRKWQHPEGIQQQEYKTFS